MKSRMMFASAAACVLALAAPMLAGRYVPVVPPSGLVAQQTWQDSLIASREALFQREAQKHAEDRKAAEALFKTCEPLEIEMHGTDAPRTIRVRLGGLKRFYIGADGECSAFLGDPRFIDANGVATPVAFSKARRLGRGYCDYDTMENSWTPIRYAKQTFEKGAKFREMEMFFELKEGVQWLEATVGVVNVGDKRPVQIWVAPVSHLQPREVAASARISVWNAVQRAFADAATAREQRLEEALIWRADWQPGDYAAIANRYASACAAAQKPAAIELARSCKSIAEIQQVRDLFYVQHAAARVDLARRTLAFVERSAARPEFHARLDTLEKQVQTAAQSGTGAQAAFAAVCDLRRQIIVSHPLLDFDQLLINERSDRLPEHMCDQYLGRHSQAAPGLFILDSWKSNPQPKSLLAGKLPEGGVLHPDLSYDAKRVIFAFADDSQPKQDHRLRGYYIYELSLETRKLRQITGTSSDPMVGQKSRETVLIEDVDPCYLPDGGFAFISTRSQQYGRCHGSRYVPSYTLYRGELDGSNIRPLSFNESNEWGPAVLHDGSLVYTRWDYVNRHDVRFQSLWSIRPDGTQTAHYYGNNSPSPCLIGEAQPIPGSQKVIATAAAHHGQTLGTLIIVDPLKGQEHGEPLTWITPELRFPESGVPQGITLAARPLAGDIPDGDARASTPWPLSEDLFLCTYPHGDRHAIYLVDTLGGRELIYQNANTSCFNPIPLKPRTMPPAVSSTIAGKESQKTGVFYVENVYQSTQPIPPGSIRRMRINEIISQPTSSSPVRSFANNELVKKVLGTVPVNADGSVAFEAPANTPMQFQLLDENGMAVMTMRSLVYLQPGEQASCVGCHESRYSAPPIVGLPGTKVSQIAPSAGPKYEGGLSFVRTVQPVLDRYCIDCHGLNQTAGNIDLTGGMDARTIKRAGHAGGFSTAYWSLISLNGMVKIAPRNGETIFSTPKDYFAHAGRLAKLLLDGHPDKQNHARVHLDADSMQRVIDWLDLNGQFYGDYSFNRIENQPVRAEGEKALRLAIEKRFGKELAGQPYAALVNVAMPTDSRILMAALPVQAGGWGQIANGYKDTQDPAYKEMRQLVEASITPLPYRDIAGTCGRGDHCVCGTCWVRQLVEATKRTASSHAAAAH